MRRNLQSRGSESLFSYAIDDETLDSAGRLSTQLPRRSSVQHSIKLVRDLLSHIIQDENNLNKLENIIEERGTLERESEIYFPYDRNQAASRPSNRQASPGSTRDSLPNKEDKREKSRSSSQGSHELPNSTLTPGVKTKSRDSTKSSINNNAVKVKPSPRNSTNLEISSKSETALPPSRISFTQDSMKTSHSSSSLAMSRKPTSEVFSSKIQSSESSHISRDSTSTKQPSKNRLSRDSVKSTTSSHSAKKQSSQKSINLGESSKSDTDIRPSRISFTQEDTGRLSKHSIKSSTSVHSAKKPLPDESMNLEESSKSVTPLPLPRISSKQPDKNRLSKQSLKSSISVHSAKKPSPDESINLEESSKSVAAYSLTAHSTASQTSTEKIKSSESGHLIEHSSSTKQLDKNRLSRDSTKSITSSQSAKKLMPRETTSHEQSSKSDTDLSKISLSQDSTKTPHSRTSLSSKRRSLSEDSKRKMQSSESTTIEDHRAEAMPKRRRDKSSDSINGEEEKLIAVNRNKPSLNKFPSNDKNSYHDDEDGKENHPPQGRIFGTQTSYSEIYEDLAKYLENMQKGETITSEDIAKVISVKLNHLKEKEAEEINRVENPQNIENIDKNKLGTQNDQNSLETIPNRSDNDQNNLDTNPNRSDNDNDQNNLDTIPNNLDNDQSNLNNNAFNLKYYVVYDTSEDNKLKCWQRTLEAREKIAENIMAHTGKRPAEILFNRSNNIDPQERQMIQRLMDYSERMNSAQNSPRPPPSRSNENSSRPPPSRSNEYVRRGNRPLCEIQETMPRLNKRENEINNVPDFMRQESSPSFANCPEFRSQWIRSVMDQRIRDRRFEPRRIVDTIPNTSNLSVSGQKKPIVIPCYQSPPITNRGCPNHLNKCFCNPQYGAGPNGPNGP